MEKIIINDIYINRVLNKIDNLRKRIISYFKGAKNPEIMGYKYRKYIEALDEIERELKKDHYFDLLDQEYSRSIKIIGEKNYQRDLIENIDHIIGEEIRIINNLYSSKNLRKLVVNFEFDSASLHEDLQLMFDFGFKENIKHFVSIVDTCRGHRLSRRQKDLYKTDLTNALDLIYDSLVTILKNSGRNSQNFPYHFSLTTAFGQINQAKRIREKIDN